MTPSASNADRIVILMSSSPQHRSVFAFPWYADGQPESGLAQRLEPFYKWCRIYWKQAEALHEKTSPALHRIGGLLDQTLLAGALIVLPKAFAGWDAVYPAALAKARVLLPFIPLASAEEEALEHDPAWGILAEFQKLGVGDQDKAAKNLALLWGHFEDTFGGLSGFLAESQAEQSQYLEKLKAASQRMRLARGSAVAFHYVTVELMRQYVCCLQQRRSDRPALSLAACVAALINRGRLMTLAIAAPDARPAGS
jgi:hypothetical protein